MRAKLCRNCSSRSKRQQLVLYRAWLRIFASIPRASSNQFETLPFGEKNVSWQLLELSVGHGHGQNIPNSDAAIENVFCSQVGSLLPRRVDRQSLAREYIPHASNRQQSPVFRYDPKFSPFVP